MDQQKILGYFIEEAKEHLETLEHGILELETVMGDQERLNEMFRAAHSVKGGAAMLGYTSIQKTAHRLEDAFKILRENPVAVDQTLESLFLKGYDVLQDLVEKLQGPFGLQVEEAESIVEGASQNFEELQNYLNYLLSHSTLSRPAAAPEPVVAEALGEVDLPEEIKKILRQMLALFKQTPGDPAQRQQLESHCQRLAQLSPQENWQKVVKLVRQAVANPRHSFRALAPVVLKDLKQACDYFELEQPAKIVPSAGLKQLAQAQTPQILLPAEPGAAANVLLQIFNKQQVKQLVQLLSQQRG
ncbi:MAG: Hpt domain-containing protein [Cyanobacteriota bacterium]